MKLFSNKIAWIATVLIVIAVGIAGYSALKSIVIAPPSITQIEKMGHLVALKVNVADVVEFTADRTLDIPWSLWQVKYGGTKVILIVKGDCSVATDLRAATYESIDKENKTVTILLPTPSVLQPRVIHASTENGGSKIYAISRQGVEVIMPGNANLIKAIDSAMSLAQKKVEEAGNSPDVIRGAKENTELILKGFLAALGWNANIKWK